MTDLSATDLSLDERIEGVMLTVSDPFVGAYQVPGWRCRACGWTVGTAGLPPSHRCNPDPALALAERWPADGVREEEA